MSKTCLIVDDSKVIRKVVRRILEDMQFSVAEAADGLEALDHCRQFSPDLVMLDWNMPQMSGMDFLAALKAEQGDTRPKIVFCTTENGRSHIEAAMAAGADEYVMKPFDRDTLQTKLAMVGCA